MKSETDQKRERQGGQQETNRGLRNDMLSANDTNIMTAHRTNRSILRELKIKDMDRLVPI